MRSSSKMTEKIKTKKNQNLDEKSKSNQVKSRSNKNEKMNNHEKNSNDEQLREERTINFKNLKI